MKHFSKMYAYECNSWSQNIYIFTKQCLIAFQSDNAASSNKVLIF